MILFGSLVTAEIQKTQEMSEMMKGEMHTVELIPLANISWAIAMEVVEEASGLGGGASEALALGPSCGVYPI